MKYFIIAGEASGDLHASNLMREIKLSDPEAEFCFLGGDLMLAQGGEQIKDYREMAFMGFISVIKNRKKIQQNFEDCKRGLLRFNPDLVILIDYPSFNLRIANFVKKELKTPVHYYISPKIWAWKRFRIHSIKRNVDKMFCILPFEPDFYAKYNYAADYVGNPSVDSVHENLKKEETEEEFWFENELPQKPIIAILPGSRRQEIAACLSTMVRASEGFTDYQIVVAGAPGIEPDFYDSILKEKEIKLIFNKTYQLLQHARVAIINSGTASLEAALIGTPQIVVYHVPLGRFAYLLKKIFIRVKYISLVNIIAKKEIVKELIAHQFTAANITFELEKIVRNSEYRNEMTQNYSMIQKKLGQPGAAKKTAEEIVKIIKQTN